MLDQGPCIHCKRVGFVRVEYVIKGGTTNMDFYCGACDYSWTRRDEDFRSTPRARRRVGDKPERSRS
jgi:hypothetical protein